MESKNKEKSIFDANILISRNDIPHILEDIELISNNNPKEHILSASMEHNSANIKKNNMVELIKTGYNLPEADEPEKMLCNSSNKKETEEDKKNIKTDAFKIINLVSKNYNLPKVNNDDLLK